MSKQTKKKVAKKKATKKKVTKKKVAKKKTSVKKVTKKKVAKKKISAKKKITKKKAGAKKITKKKLTKKKADTKKNLTKKKVVKKKKTKKKTSVKKITKKKVVKKKISAKKKTSIKQDKKLDLKEDPQVHEHGSPLEECTMEDIQMLIKKLDFFSSKDDECLYKNCDNPTTTLGYCRLHYIKEWREIKSKQEILDGDRLTALIEDIINKHPTPYIESLISDLENDQSFYLALKELNIESNFEDIDDSDDGELEASEISDIKTKKSFNDE